MHFSIILLLFFVHIHTLTTYFGLIGHLQVQELVLSFRFTSLSLFFPSFVRLIDVFNTLLVFLTLCHF
jgi:hypothetical protein